MTTENTNELQFVVPPFSNHEVNVTVGLSNEYGVFLKTAAGNMTEFEYRAVVVTYFGLRLSHFWFPSTDHTQSKYGFAQEIRTVSTKYR